MNSLAVNDHSADGCRQRAEETIDAVDHFIIHRVALFRARQTQHCDLVVQLNGEGRREVELRGVGHLLNSFQKSEVSRTTDSPCRFQPTLNHVQPIGAPELFAVDDDEGRAENASGDGVRDRRPQAVFHLGALQTGADPGAIEAN